MYVIAGKESELLPGDSIAKNLLFCIAEECVQGVRKNSHSEKYSSTFVLSVRNLPVTAGFL
jgi:hypothetical protein